MAVSGDQVAATAMENSERPEAIILQFENPFGMIEWRRFTRERHRLECHERSLSAMLAKMGRIPAKQLFAFTSPQC